MKFQVRILIVKYKARKRRKREREQLRTLNVHCTERSIGNFKDR